MYLGSSGFFFVENVGFPKTSSGNTATDPALLFVDDRGKVVTFSPGPAAVLSPPLSAEVCSCPARCRVGRGRCDGPGPSGHSAVPACGTMSECENYRQAKQRDVDDGSPSLHKLLPCAGWLGFVASSDVAVWRAARYC